MSIETRAYGYGRAFGGWDLHETPVGRGSRSGDSESTMVYKLTRKGYTMQEESALKIVNIVSKEGIYAEATEYEKQRYHEECGAKCKAAEEEVQLMYELRGASNVASYLDYKIEPWQEINRYGCDLLIRMNLFDGSLQGEIGAGHIIPESEIVRIGLNLCTALKECHRRKIIHRDIKPHNIFIKSTKAGKEYLLGDFGISKILENRDFAVTATGTQEYMAPEQFTIYGSSQYDKRVDIYSLGLVLYQLANGNRLPFSTPTGYVDQSAITRRISGEPLPRLDMVSLQLAQIIMRACAYRKEDRYQNAEDFFEALYEVQRGIPTQENVHVDVQTRLACREDLYQTMVADAYEGIRYDMDPLGNGHKSQSNMSIQPQAEEETPRPNTAISVLVGSLITLVLALGIALVVLFWPESETEKMISYRVEYIWDDGGNVDGKRTQEVVVILMANGEEYVDEEGNRVKVLLSQDNNWCARVSDLYAQKEGEEIQYSFMLKTQLEGYITNYEYESGKTIITNSYIVTPEPEPESAPEEVIQSEPEILFENIDMRHVIDIVATSELREPQELHHAGNAVDGNRTSAWIEGRDGQGIGEEITLVFNGFYYVKGIHIHNGFQKSEDLYYKNSRPEYIRIYCSDGINQTVRLDDFMEMQTIEFDEPILCNQLSIYIESVYPGSKYEDTAISEINLY